jgi:hypothetical protein
MRVIEPHLLHAHIRRFPGPGHREAAVGVAGEAQNWTI